jgi:LacI family transcriptional regulator
VTINDVARLAGVSPMTVSRVVNQEKNVRPAKREAVLAAVRQLNYAPNLAARSLAKAEEIKIGVIYNNPSAAYLSEFLVGVLDETAGKGAQLVLVKCEAVDEPAERKAVAQLLAASVTGVVLPPPLSESEVVRDALKAAGVATVAVATGGARTDLSSVRVDDSRAAYDMTVRLLQLGHRRIGFIKGHPNQTASAERLEGFRAAMAEAPDAQAAVVQGYFTFASGLTAAEELFEGPLAITAIFASNDDMAAAAVSVAHRRGLDVPKDLTVVGFDDTSVAVTLWPPLTTVRQPVSEMATVAIDLLLSEIRARRGGDPPPRVDKITPHVLIERQSSGPAPGP